MAARFDAFLSYSRRASSGLTTDLQTSVERFAKPWYRMRAIRVFRDDASMSANTALWSNIERGLREAEWFVLVASPAAAASEYVGNEVSWWLKHKSAERMIIVLEEGVDIVWDREANDFDWDRTDSLPRALSKAFAEEPRWIDLRWYEPEGLRKADPRWDERVADIAAAVRFAERDQLIGENVREHRKARRILRAGVVGLSVLLVASLVATFIAVGQRREAQRQTQVAVEQRREATTQARIALARQLAAQAVSLAPTDLRTASLLAVQAFRTNDDAQTRAALFQVATASPQLVRTLPVGSKVTVTAVTPDGVVVTGDEDGGVMVWDGSVGRTVATLPGVVSDLAVSQDGTAVAAVDGSRAVVAKDGVEIALEGARAPFAVAISEDGSRVATSGARTRGGTSMWTIQGTVPGQVRTVRRSGHDLTFGRDGLLILSLTGRFALVDPDTQQELAGGTHGIGAYAEDATLSADGSAIAGAVATVDYPVWRGPAAYSGGEENNAIARTSVNSRDIALSSDGSQLAALVEGLIEVAPVRSPLEPFVRPLRLEGTGVLEPETLAFGGNRYLTMGTGSTALVWDLDQLFRLGTQVVTDVPFLCANCGPVRVVPAPDGERVLMSGSRGGGEVVTEIATGAGIPLDDEGEPRDLFAATWLDEDLVIAYSGTEQALVSLDSRDASMETLLPLEVGLEQTVVAIQTDGREGTGSVLLDDGTLHRVDLSTQQVTSTSDALAGSFDGLTFGIAPDQSIAFAHVYDFDASQELVRVVDTATDEIVYSGPAVGATFDGESRLHVFDGTQVGTLDGNGSLVDRVPAQVDVYPPAVVTDPDLTIAVTGGASKAIRLLDLQRQGAVLGRLEVPAQEGLFPSSAFAQDGASLVTAIPAVEGLGLPPVLRRLSLDPQDWVTAACQVAARDLTEEDWARYGVGQAPKDLRCVQ